MGLRRKQPFESQRDARVGEALSPGACRIEPRRTEISAGQWLAGVRIARVRQKTVVDGHP